MGKERKINGQQIFDTMVNFARLGKDDGINSFTLAGPVDVPTIFHTFVGNFPDFGGTNSSVAIAGTSNVNALSVYPKVLGLEIPARVKALGIEDVEQIRKAFELVYARVNFPSIVVGIGEARDTEEEVIVMFSLQGMSPSTVLLELKDRIRSRMAKFN